MQRAAPLDERVLLECARPHLGAPQDGKAASLLPGDRLAIAAGGSMSALGGSRDLVLVSVLHG
jgi:hypothetical protein